VWSDWGRGAVFQPYGADADGPWLGWQVNRGELDGGLLCQTVQAGVKVLQPVRATAALVEQRRVVGVQTPNGALTARWTVDAAGGRHFLARQLRLPIRRMSPRLVAWYGYVRGCCPTRDTAPLVTAASDGWVWTARVAVERYAWVRLSWRPGRQPPPPDEFDGLVPEGSIHGVDVTWRVVEPAAGPGFFLCGDAGAILDPSAAHGVIRGLISGMMAGHLISHSYGNELSAAKAYDDWLTDRFDADSTALRELYRVHPTPPSWT
jgi:flavin-dependent dehydrogenase